MQCTYNNKMTVRAELTHQDSAASLNTPFKIASSHVDSDFTTVKTCKGYTEPVSPRGSPAATSLNESEFTQQGCSALDNKFKIYISQFQGFLGYLKKKEQEEKLTQVKSMKVEQCALEQDPDQKYLDSKLLDPLNPDDCFQIFCALNLEDDYTESMSMQSDSSGKSESESSYRQLESISSAQILHKSHMPNSPEDFLYSAQSESFKSEMLFQDDSLKISKSAFDDDQNDLLISTQYEDSHFDTSEKWQYSMQSPTKCTEESEITLSEYQVNVCFSRHLESCRSEKLKRLDCLSDSDQSWSASPRESNQPIKSETSLPEGVGWVSLVDNESNCLIRHLSSLDKQLSKRQAGSSGQPLDGTFKVNYEDGRFNKPDTELDVIKKPYSMTSEVFGKGVQRQINVQNKIYYWRQVMQLYFTVMTASSIAESLKWLFHLRLVTTEALQRLQSFLTYPFHNLKEYFHHVSSDSPPGVEECMSVEWMRLQTFQNYPNTANGSPNRLAREGFYYTGQETQTRCFSCGVTYAEWNYLDNPHEVHQRLSPNCPFLNGRQEGHRNIPMSLNESADNVRGDSHSIPFLPLPAATLSGSATGQSRVEVSRSVSKAKEEDERIRQQQSGSGETTHGAAFHPAAESAQSESDDRPRFPEHVTLSSRIETFNQGWPPYLDQTPQQMAEAGFFFTGNQDYTRCYQCGGGLRNWEPGDNPWIEHCRWYPMCLHVQQGKGQRFVNAVLKKQSELLSVQRAESRRKVQYGIDITDPLETLAAISLLEMGYPRDTIRNSILVLRRQKEPGADVTALEVLDLIWKEEDAERLRQELEASRPHIPGYHQQSPQAALTDQLNLSGSHAVTQAVVHQSPITTTASSITKVAMTIKSVTTTASSTPGTSTITSISTSTSALNSSTLSQGQREGEVLGDSTIIGGNGKKSGGSMQRGNTSEDSMESKAVSHEGLEQGEQRPSLAMAGQAEGPGAHAQAIAAAINEDVDFQYFENEQMENKDVRELEEENKKLKEQATCKICMENVISVIFLPCAHLVCCETCAPAFRKCPICRKRIEQAVKTFL